MSGPRETRRFCPRSAHVTVNSQSFCHILAGFGPGETRRGRPLSSLLSRREPAAGRMPPGSRSRVKRIAGAPLIWRPTRWPACCSSYFGSGSPSLPEASAQRLGCGPGGPARTCGVRPTLKLHRGTRRRPADHAVPERLVPCLAGAWGQSPARRAPCKSASAARSSARDRAASLPTARASPQHGEWRTAR